MAETIVTQQMLINGQWVDSLQGDWIDVENPSTKTVFAKVPRANAHDVDLAVTASKRASHSWKRTAAADRGKMLFAIADGLEANREKIARLISTENGNALRTQSRGEASVTVDIFRYVAGLARELKGKTVYLNSDNLDYTRREPYGVVGAIVPWNAPLMLAALKIAPAIMTGNTMVLKASEEAPLAVLEMARICSEILPAGVLNVLTGYGVECGARIAEHPDIPKVSFTGSTAVGKSILAAASNRIASVSLELGGKSAQIVLPDVDHNYTADGVITAMRFTRQGQSCTAGSRLFLHESIADSFLATLTDKLKKMRIGNPLNEENDTGSLVNAKQFSRVSSYVQEAIDKSPNSLLIGGLPPMTGPLS